MLLRPVRAIAKYDQAVAMERGSRKCFFIPLAPLARSREITANTISTWVKNVVRAYETIAGEDLQVSGTMAHESRSMAAS